MKRRGDSWTTLHRIARDVWEEWWNQGVPKGYLIHHVDENPHNNEITNLALVTYTFHIKRHFTEETSEKLRKAMLGQKRFFSKAHREKLGKKVKERWANPEYRKNIVSKIGGEKHHFYGRKHNEEAKRKMREAHRRRRNEQVV